MKSDTYGQKQTGLKQGRYETLHLIYMGLGGLVILFIVGPLMGMFLNTSAVDILEVSRDTEVQASIWLTLWTSMTGALFFSLLAVPFAYVLARKEFPFKRLVTGIIDLPIVVPHTAAGIAVLGVISRDSMLGQLAGSLGFRLVGNPIGIMAAMAFVSIPFLINSARDGFLAVPERLEKAALNLGASPFRVFYTISLPLAWKSVLSGIILMWARGMSEFGAVVIVAYHPMISPILIYERFSSFGLSYARPISVLFLFICLSVFILLRLLSGKRKMLSIRNVSVKLGRFPLSDISLTIDEGEYIVILGMSGVGKTVLLEILAGIVDSDEGTLVLDDADITRQQIQKRPIGLVYQDQALFPHLSVRRNLEYGLRCQKLPATSTKQKAQQIATDLGIDHLLHRSPSTLSGGEAQRVALGRALVTNPRVLLLDEPLSALDPHSRSNMQALLRRIHRQGQTIIHVTHDYEEAVSLASRIVLMENGTIAQTGAPNEIFRQPKSKFVAHFMGMRNFFDGELVGSKEKGTELATFHKNGVSILMLADSQSGPGYCTLRSEDIILSNQPNETSVQNQFPGTIRDIIPTSIGVEVIVDIGIELSALITQQSISKLNLVVGKQIYAGFKATAARFIKKDEMS